MARVLRLLVTTRKRLNEKVLIRILSTVFASQSREKLREFLFPFVKTGTDSQNQVRNTDNVRVYLFITSSQLCNVVPPPNLEDTNFFKPFTEEIFIFIGQCFKKYAPSAHK